MAARPNQQEEQEDQEDQEEQEKQEEQLGMGRQKRRMDGCVMSCDKRKLTKELLAHEQTHGDEEAQGEVVDDEVSSCIL